MEYSEAESDKVSEEILSSLYIKFLKTLQRPVTGLNLFKLFFFLLPGNLAAKDHVEQLILYHRKGAIIP